MKDETSMKTPVSSIDGSRFTAASTAPASRALPPRFLVSLPEESMVIDDRSLLSPAQAVESKLIHRLKESSLPVSHLQMRGLVRNRYES